MMVLVSGKKIPNVPGNQIEQSLGHLISKFRRHVENINANREDSEEQIV